MLKQQTQEEVNLEKAKKEEERVEAQKADALIKAKEQEKVRKGIEESDAKKIAAEQEAAEKAENEVLKKQLAARKKFLSTPLNETEEAEIKGLEALAMSGKSVDPGNMKRLADLRIKKKVKK